MACRHCQCFHGTLLLLVLLDGHQPLDLGAVLFRFAQVLSHFLHVHDQSLRRFFGCRLLQSSCCGFFSTAALLQASLRKLGRFDFELAHVRVPSIELP